MAESLVEFGVRKEEELNKRIVKWLDDNTDDWGKDESYTLILEGERPQVLDCYTLYFAYLYDIEVFETLLKRHHKKYFLAYGE